MQMGPNEGRAPERGAGAEGLLRRNGHFLTTQWPLFPWNYFQNKQHLKSIPHTPQMLAFAHQRRTRLWEVVVFSSSVKSHLKFISIVMSPANNPVRKIYLHTSHLCFHVISALPINTGFYGS